MKTLDLSTSKEKIVDLTAEYRCYKVILSNSIKQVICHPLWMFDKCNIRVNCVCCNKKTLYRCVQFDKLICSYCSTLQSIDYNLYHYHPRVRI